MDEQELEPFCKKHGFRGYFLTSAKLSENNGIDDMAQFLVKEVLKHEVGRSRGRSFFPSVVDRSVGRCLSQSVRRTNS